MMSACCKAASTLRRYADRSGITEGRRLASTTIVLPRALGGAWLPLHANFAPDRDLFLKVGT